MSLDIRTVRETLFLETYLTLECSALNLCLHMGYAVGVKQMCVTGFIEGSASWWCELAQ